MKIGFIGAGKVGISLGCYFYKKKENISGYYSLKDFDACEGASRTNSHMFKDVQSLILSSNLIFITVNDDQIEKVVETLKNLDISSSQWEGKVLAHTSGAHSHLCLKGLAQEKVEYVSMHPLLAFSNVEESIKNLEDVHFSIDNHSKTIESLLNRLGNPFFVIKPEDKGLYHLASVVTSNFLVSVIDYALDIYQSIGISEEHLLQGIKPLLYGNLDNVMNFGTVEGLTGPIKRGDVKTVQKHIDSLRLKDENEKLSLYLQLAKKNLELARKDGCDNNGRDEIKRLLNEEINKSWKK